jgi:DNA-binding SARP family transcriptional activator
MALESALATEERLVAQATMIASATQEEADLKAAADFLSNLATRQEAGGHLHYAAITRLNLAVILLWMGRSGDAASEAGKAEARLGNRLASAERVAATAVRAAVAVQRGDLTSIDELLAIVAEATTTTARDEAAVEAARLLTDYGPLDRARALVDGASAQSLSGGYRGLWAAVRATQSLRAGDASGAETALGDAGGVLQDAAGKFRLTLLAVRAALARGEMPGEGLLELRRLARAQRSDLCLAIADLASGAALGNPSDAIGRLLPEEYHLLSVLAEEVTRAMPGLTVEALGRVQEEARRRPSRWASALRLVYDREPTAAKLLAEIGSQDDFIAMRNAAVGSKWLRPIAAAFARRLAPAVEIHDLGPVRVLVGSQPPVKALRRKVLALLCFLATRPNMAATRDEAVEAIWPDLGPDTAVNSLHQTIYYLRRVIEPSYREGLSARYIEFDGEVVPLDKSLISSTSQRCWQLLEQAAKGHEDALDKLLAVYKAPYALDFAYEEWAVPFRETLHAAVLGAAEAAIEEALASGRGSMAVHLAQQVLSIDPRADAIELGLLRAYKASGRHAAAAEQYAHYATLMREELGVEPPPLSEL